MSWSSISTECARLAAGGGSGALASVARRRGSLPMSATAKMLITTEGARLGTVGGGCLEAEIIERATAVAEKRAPAVTEHTLNAELAGDYGLTCGGTAVMFIEPVFPDATLSAVYAEVSAALSRGERAVLATGDDWSNGIEKMLVRERATIGKGSPRLAVAAEMLDPLREEPELRSGILVEPVVGPPRLVVFGAGHVGARVAQAASFAGWRVTVIDDRAEFADPARLPFAERALVCDYGAVPPTVGVDAATYVVIATRGHQHDALILEQVARMDARYIGMLGSRRKVALTRRLLEEWGVAPDMLSRVHAPIGLPIGADTPEEIAVSIVAEMIGVRRAGTRRRGGASASAVAADD
ncbi:MAG: XdhC family protein [Gemmatimonadota bacterium]|nr:XdhC family protein [Gemmatimonadota bacterium]